MPHNHSIDDAEEGNTILKDHWNGLSMTEPERIHFQNVIATFNHYAQYSLSANNRRRKDVFALSREDQDVLDKLGYKKKLDEVDTAILANADFLAKIVENPEIFGHDLEEEEDPSPSVDPRQAPEPHHSHSHGHGAADHSHDHGHSHSPGHGHHHSHDQHHGSGHGHRRKKYKPTEFDMDKLRSTLKQFVRDWSEEGAQEREMCYQPLIDALVEFYPNAQSPEDRSKLRVLVPGAGLGRLAWDVAKLGFSCQGNEFSHYMLLSSYFILNRTESIGQHKVYPYVHSFSNVPNRQSMLREISIPDVPPSSLPPTSNFSLVAGDFEEIYGVESDPDEPQSGQWDAVLTCFFIDTARNIVNYLRTIHKILAPGGVWVNLGPLLWHFENNNTNDLSIELDLEEIKALAREIGFEISNERDINATYTNNSESMLGYVYKTAFWTATKVA